ncbi:hypothetical protein EW145_g6977 [Phellinidium pouzarii]|uniref:BHLH domain-containing protein n=1 Tax=Phellinidium pouzarii TaxID=167371 RepID=A0A4S4KR66_9AGAM|nr:hypothetical protein EW145_g6977 [Phellinidium pouzarii]
MSVADFQFSFDPSLFPEPPTVPPSAELFSASETSDIFGFLDNFSDLDFGSDTFNAVRQNAPPSMTEPFLSAYPELNANGAQLAASSSSNGTESSVRSHPYQRQYRQRSPSPRTRSPSSPNLPPNTSSSSTSSSGPGLTRTKVLLSDPQKRMNHIMSEQKRRNAIREGYAQLTTLLAPAGAPPGSGMPTRGRPKGSGAKGKARSGAGKSGVLLRAVEYCQWLEEGRDALLEEVGRVEAAAGIRMDF